MRNILQRLVRYAELDPSCGFIFQCFRKITTAAKLGLLNEVARNLESKLFSVMPICLVIRDPFLSLSAFNIIPVRSDILPV
jgi:hypothetical protein